MTLKPVTRDIQELVCLFFTEMIFPVAGLALTEEAVLAFFASLTAAAETGKSIFLDQIETEFILADYTQARQDGEAFLCVVEPK